MLGQGSRTGSRVEGSWWRLVGEGRSVKISCGGHKGLMRRSLDVGWLDEVLRWRFRVQGPPNEGPGQRSPDKGLGRELIRVCKIKVGERAPCLYVLWHYI
jgi:hypothetical protein